MKKRVISMICVIALLLSMTTLSIFSYAAEAPLWIDKDPAKNVDYSFAVVGDIQTITYKDTHSGTRYVSNLFKWLILNQKSRRISYVFGLGDTVETLTSYPESYNPSVNNPREWELASAQISMLNGIIPYSVVRGNHDDEGGYHRNICTDFYISQMDGFYYDPGQPATAGNSMSNSYRKIDICGHKYLMITLDYNITEGVKDWVNDIISSNPDYHVIVSIHAYLHNSGRIYNGAIGQASADPTVQENIVFNGQALWDDVFSQHKNMFMVLCGHASTPAPNISTKTGVNGNEVLQILVDPQSEDEIDPTGMVLMINVKEGGAKLEFEYLSTSRQKTPYRGEANQFTIDTPGNPLPYVSVEPQPEITKKTTVTAKETEATTAAPRTTKEKAEIPLKTTEEYAAQSGVTCSGAITSTLSVACVIGATLSVFAMRKKRDD